MNIAKALEFGGWPGLILLLAGNALGVGAWGTCLVLRRYRAALYAMIMAFPFTFYAGRAAGIRAFDIEDFDQRVGPTTFMMIALFAVMYLRGRIRRPPKGISRWVERFLWLYAISLTIGQFVTHDAWDAFFLSMGAAWQFVCLFYILISLIDRDRHLFALLNSVFVFSILNILVRVVAKGESLIVSLSSQTAGNATAFGADAGRVGSGALGPGVSYAGYLAIFITLGLAMYYVSRHSIYLAYTGLMFLELLNTFTRGGVYVLGFLVILLSFRRTRAIVLKIGLAAGVAGLFAWPWVYRYITFRGFSFNVMHVNTFSLRVLLTQLYFRDYYHFTWWGNGILRETMVELQPWLIVPVHNAYLDILDTCGVIPCAAFAIFSILAVGASVKAARIRRRSRMPASFRMTPFVVVCLLQWIIFANTTATSVLGYYPYEGTAVFFLVATLPLIFIRIAHRRVVVRRSPAAMQLARPHPVPPGVPSPA
ncbi:MAG TPA: hypothetical protein VGJ81_13285 [Thermoanaerobaculia bacterium]|jgi:hypothetical protein